MGAASLQRDWLDALAPGPLRHLFDHLPQTLFFAKDKQSRLMMGNPAFVRHCGFEHEAQIVGLTDLDLRPVFARPPVSCGGGEP